MVRLTGVGDAYKSRTQIPRNTKIARKVAHPTGNNAVQVRGQKVKGQGHQADYRWNRKCVAYEVRTSNLV